MAVKSDFIEKTQPVNILDVISQELLERLLDSYCFLSKTPLTVYYPTELPVTKDNLKPLQLIYGDTSRLDPLNFPFCLEYWKLCPKYAEACKEWDKNSVMKYYSGNWDGPKLFHCYLWLWEMTYPLYAEGRLLGVLYGGQSVVSSGDVADWRDALREVADEVVWEPADEAIKIPEKSNQVEEICETIDKNPDIRAEDKKGLKELLRKAVEDKGITVANLVKKYRDFKELGLALKRAMEDLYAAKAEMARHEHKYSSSKNITEAGDRLTTEPERFWNTLDQVVENTLPYVKGYALYKPDKYGEGFEPVRTCIYDKQLILGTGDFRNFCKHVFEELHEKGKKKKELIVYDLLDENVPQKIFRDLFQRVVGDLIKIAGGASVVAIPLAETEHKITGGLVCVCARVEKGEIGEAGVSERFLKFYVEALKDIASVLSMVLARHSIVQAQADAWAVRSHELIAPINAVKGYQDNLTCLFRDCIADKLVNDTDVKNTFVAQLGRLGTLCELLEHIAKGGSLEGGEYFVPVNFEKQVLLPIVQPLRDYGKMEKYVVVWYSDKISNLPRLWVFTDGMKRCMFNLIFNAIKYSYKKSTVTVELRESQDNYEIQIINEGIGVPPGEEELIFQRFRQGSNADKVAAYGAGLGLYVARQMARIHGGDVELISREPKKTIFALILPKSLEYGPPSQFQMEL